MVKQVALLLHMYQPPWQDVDMLYEADEKNYGWLIPHLARQKFLKTTVNSPYSLIEKFFECGLEQNIESLGEGQQNGAIEMTGTVAYHPILPLIPEDEIKRQIEINHEKHEEIFKGVWNPKGFFPPEMAFSNDIAKIVQEFGYKWMITEDIVYDIDRKIPTTSVATLDEMPIFFRTSYMSNRFSFPTDDEGKPIDTIDAVQFVHWLNGEIGDNSYAILALDLETIGLHLYYTQKTIDYLAGTMEHLGMESVHISDLLDKYPVRLEMNESKTYQGSWSTTKEDLLAGIPYKYWKDPTNKIHKIQWQLLEYVIDAVKNAEGSEGYAAARDLLDKGEQSCQFWWAAPENIKKSDYKPGNIMEGAKLLLTAVLQLDSILGESEKYVKQLYEKLHNAVQEARPM